jgi:hypothetical protein
MLFPDGIGHLKKMRIVEQKYRRGILLRYGICGLKAYPFPGFYKYVYRYVVYGILEHIRCGKNKKEYRIKIKEKEKLKAIGRKIRVDMD